MFYPANIVDEIGLDRVADDPHMKWLYDTLHQINWSPRDWMPRLLSNGNSFCQSSAMVRTSVMRQIGKQSLTLIRQQDCEYWVRCLSIANVHVLCEELTQYRRINNSNSLSSASPQVYSHTYNESVLSVYISLTIFLMIFFRINFMNSFVVRT